MPKRYFLAALALLLALTVLPARAQRVSESVNAVNSHFLQHQARYGASGLAGPDALVVTDAYTSRSDWASVRSLG